MPRSRRSQDMDLGGADSTNIQTDTPAVGEENGASASTAGATTAPPAPPAGGNTESFAGDATEAAAQAPSGAQEPPPAPERKARLLITKMEMENFKSYGGVREIGPFHKCFSSIVGPNGSGKSNVIDAMLFVFGKRAKKLRLNKVSELIHRSDTYKNLQYARVSVHFVDILDVEGSEDAYEEVPGTELVVSRTAFINNQSKYQVDGKNATFTEVGALLRKRGVDLDNNRFLILQGEVEQIAMMKPKAATQHEEGLLEYLEEIIGSDRFVSDAEEAAKAVEACSEQRSEKMNRLKLAEKDKDSLEGARAEADQFLRLDATIRKKQNVLYQAHLATAAENVEQVTRKAEEKEERLQHEQAKLATTLKEVKETKKVHETVSREFDVLKVEMKRAQEEFNEYERKDIKHRESKKFFKEQSRKLEAAIKKDQKRSADSLARAEEMEGSLGGLGRAVTQAEARKASEDTALEEVNESLKGERAELRSELEVEQEKARPVREEADALRNKVDTCKCEINLVRESTENAKKRLADAENALATLLEKAVADKAQLADAKKDSQSMEAQIKQAELEVQAAQERLEVATEAMGRAVAAEEEAKASRESAAGKSGALRALLEASVAGGALDEAGVCGRLGDLGVIAAEHDVAVSSCTGTLDHIVVQSAEGATACVEFLRRNSLGRASFVILEKLGHLDSAMSRPFQAPRGCPRLFDLVQISEPRFRPAFYLALRDTLVARDLEIATATAYEGNRAIHRVVTADGQLIDRSGAMTGGGHTQKRGAMRTTGGRGGSASGPGVGAGIVSAAQADKLSSEARKAEDAVRAARLSKKQAEGCLKKLHSRRKELQTLIPKLEMRLKGVGASEAQYKEQIDSLQAQCHLTPEAEAELKTLAKDLAKDEKSLAKVSKSLEKAEAAVQVLQKGILEVGGERLKKAVKRADAASKALDEAVDALSRSTVEGKGERKKGEKTAKDAARKSSELEVLRKKAEEDDEDFKGMMEKADKVLEQYEAAQEECSVKDKELEKIADAHEKGKALVDKIRGVEVDITHQLGEYKKKIKENERVISHWTSELEKLRRLHKKEASDWDLDDLEVDSDNDLGDDGNSDAMEEGDDDNGGKELQGEGGVEESKAEGSAEEEIKKGNGSDSRDGGKDGGEDDAMDMDDEEEGGGARARKAKKAKTTKAKSSRKEKHGAGVLAELDPENLHDLDTEALKLEIGELEAQKKAKESTVNLTALARYRESEREYHERVKGLEEATRARDEARGRHEELRRQRLKEFMDGFGQITLRLKEMYQMITLGGDAELELVDSLDPFSEGIVFSVRPPKKSWKNIANLSGGEKTLSSLALVFALHHFKPTPLYVMDEIDAALDFKNVSIVANYIKERTKNAQFIIISLRNNMFELADRLVGIYKTHNVTKSVTINPKEFAHQQHQEQAKPKALTAPKAPGVLGDATNALRTTEV